MSTNISLDTAVNKLAIKHGDFAALLYTWMIPHAEDDATLPSDPEEILYMVVPGRRDKTKDDVVKALEGMEELGLIVWERGEKIYFPVIKFYKYQTYIPQNKRADNQRTTPQIAEDRRTTAQKGASPSPSPSPSPSKDTCAPNSARKDAQKSNSSSASKNNGQAAGQDSGGGVEAETVTATPDEQRARNPFKDKEQETMFDQFWSAYPKKRSKGQAEKTWVKLQADEQLLGVILAAIERAKKSEEWCKENGRFIPYPSTWLNAKGWEDESEVDIDANSRGDPGRDGYAIPEDFFWSE